MVLHGVLIKGDVLISGMSGGLIEGSMYVHVHVHACLHVTLKKNTTIIKLLPIF